MFLLPCRSVAVGALLAVLAPSDLTAQRAPNSPRHLVVGKIEDVAWKDAKVHFFSQSRLEGIEAEDEALGRRGGRRGILARLQAGREYRVAARLEHEGRPSLWTRIARIPVGDTSFVLEPMRLPPSRPVIRLHGRKAWKDRCVLEFRLLDALGRNRQLVECLDEDDRLPSLPGDHCWIEMRMKSGRRLHLFPIPLTEKNGPSVLDFEVPPPIQVRLRILDADTDAPIEGARVFDDFSRDEDISKPGLCSDKSGSLWFWMARPTNEYGEIDLGGRMLFRVYAKGRQLACAGWNTPHFEADAPIPRPGEQGGLDLDVHLAKARKVAGRLLHFPPELLARLKLFVRMQAKMPACDDQLIWTSLPWFEVPIEKDGSYCLPRLSDSEIHIQSGIYFPDELIEDWDKLRTEGKALSRSERILPLPDFRIGTGTEAARLAPINNRLLELLDLRVQLADGSRGADLPIRILFPDNETSTAEFTRPLGTFDGRGRFRRLFYGPVPALFIRSPKDYALMEDEQRQKLRRTHPGKAAVIRLQAMPTIRGRVFRSDGTPGTGSRIILRAYQLDLARLSGGPDSRYFKAITSFALTTEVQAKQDGTFEVPYLPWPQRTLLLGAIWRDADGGYHNKSKLLQWQHQKEVSLTYPR